MSEMRALRAELPGTLISDYLYREVREPAELVLLLHGFQQSGKHLYDKLAPCFSERAAILAPNGPFPLPERKADGSYRVGFSWYFYNAPMDAYFIDMRVALELLEGLVRTLGLQKLPKRVIGFSQGGYLAPFAALRLGEARQVVGIAAEYLPEEIDEVLCATGRSWPRDCRVDSVHGERDEVVPVADARKAHEAMLARGALGKWVSFAEEGHRLTPSLVQAVRELATNPDRRSKPRSEDR